MTGLHKNIRKEVAQNHSPGFPGPPGAAWAVAADNGCKDAAKNGDLEIVGTKWGDTGKKYPIEIS